MTGNVFRFSSDSYPPTEEGRKELLRELRCVAKLSGGIDLISIGGFSLKNDFYEHNDRTSTLLSCCLQLRSHISKRDQKVEQRKWQVYSQHIS